MPAKGHNQMLAGCPYKHFSNPFPTLWTKETRTLSTDTSFSLFSNNISGPLHKLVTWNKIIHAAQRRYRLRHWDIQNKATRAKSGLIFLCCGWPTTMWLDHVKVLLFCRTSLCTVKFLARSLKFLTFWRENYWTMHFPLYSVFRVASSRMQIYPVWLQRRERQSFRL